MEKEFSCLALQQWLRNPVLIPLPSPPRPFTQELRCLILKPEWFDYCSGTKRCNRETRASSPMFLHTSAPLLFTCPPLRINSAQLP